MKAQTQLIQFILFFLISISIFSLISSYLFSFSQTSQNRLLFSFREMLASYTSGYLIYNYVDCKYCNYSILKYGIPYQVFDNFHEIYTQNNQVYIRSIPNQNQSLFSAHNLNFSTQISCFHSTGLSPIVTVSFNKTENKLKIGG